MVDIRYFKSIWIAWAAGAFIMGVGVSLILRNPPIIGGLLTLLAYILVDRILARYKTGSWKGSIADMKKI